MTISELQSSPIFDELTNFWRFVNGTIVHHDDGVRSRERLHLSQKILDEYCEEFRVERAFDDHAFNNAIEGYRG